MTNSVRLAMCVSMLLSGNGLRNCHAEFAPRSFELRRATEPPVIDGQTDESVWQTAQEIDEFFAYQSGGEPAAAKTSARLLWDDEFLYVALEMFDADIRPSSVTASQTGRDARLFLGDVIELFVREDRESPRYYEFEWSPKAGDVFDARFDERKFGPPGTDWNTDIISAVSVEGTINDASDLDTLWTVESSIPLSAFGPVSAGSEWTFTFARYDYFNPTSSDEQLMTSTIGDPDLPQAGFATGFHTYELYDDLQFVPEPASTAVIPVIVVLLLRKRRVSRETDH
jgi:hypothetical protein